MSEELQIGDIMFGKYNGKTDRVYSIDRVTKTLAFAGRRVFKREYFGGCPRPHPRPTGYSSTDYYIYTDEIAKEFKDNKIVATLKRIVWAKLDDTRLYKVATLLDIMPKEAPNAN